MKKIFLLNLLIICLLFIPSVNADTCWFGGATCTYQGNIYLNQSYSYTWTTGECQSACSAVGWNFLTKSTWLAVKPNHDPGINGNWNIPEALSSPSTPFSFTGNNITQYAGGRLEAFCRCDIADIGFKYWNLTNSEYVPPTTNRTLILTVKNLANQALSNIPTALFINDGSYSNAIYTNVSGIAVYNDVPIPSNTSSEITTSATGIYSAYHEDFNFDSSPLSKTIYLQPVSPSGTYSNFTYSVKDTNGVQISNAYIEHRINNNYELIDLTDNTGRKTFYNVPVVNNAWYYTAYKSGYVDYSSYASISSPFPSDVNINVTLQGGGVFPTPTITPTPSITPVQGLEWTLSANPNSILLGDSSMLWLTAPNSAEQAKAKSILYYENNNLGAYSTFVLKGTYKYNTTSSQWDFKNPVTNQWTYGGQDSSILTVYPATTGTYTYKATIFDNGTFPYTTGNVIGTAQTNLVIGGGGGGNENLVCLISATDGSTSSHLSDWTLSITDAITGASNNWNNLTYDKSVSLVRGREYSATGSKYGYVTNTITITPPLDQNVITGDMGTFFNIPLFKSSDISAGNTTVVVTVYDAENYLPLPNAYVQVTGQTGKFTGTQGESVSFILPQSTDYTVTASKDGYCGSSTFKNTGVLDYQYDYLYIKYGACQGVTPTHTPIPNSTINVTPSVTPLNPYGNYGVGNASVCNQLPVNATIVDQVKNSIACMGAVDKTSQDMFLALLIILLIGGIAATKAKGIGFAIGSILGAGIALVMGLIPFWLIVLLIIACIAVIAVMIGKSNGG